MRVLDHLKEKWIAPTEPDESFEGQVFLVTGANTGLGLEVAKKIAGLNARRLIITTRSSEKGSVAKEQIEKWLSNNKKEQTTEIIPLVLDMSSSEGVKAFSQKLSATTDQLDATILNAGLSAAPYRVLPDGYEETIQVNTVSTIFLASLLLPLLISTAKMKRTQTRLLFVSSRASTNPGALPNDVSAEQLQSPLKSFSEKRNCLPGVTGALTQYDRSKLFLEYAKRRMSKLPALRDGRGNPYVIIHSVCPGIVYTDIGRNLEGWFWGMVRIMLFTVAGRPIPWGATTYLQALSADEDTIGQLWLPEKVQEEWPALTSEEGLKFGDSVWAELKARMKEWDGNVCELLD